MSQDLLRLALRVFLTNEEAVWLSVLMAVGPCGWPKAFNIFQIGIAKVQLLYTPPVSALAAEETTCFRVLHSAWIGAFNVECIGVGGWVGVYLLLK